ncbi:MAG TPA: tetratricopeptide repeat protein [Acidobacteriaceae bacterium]|nr:tetratricopeptide repeat protein [Acidobacteriaceae bacterium]
MTRYNRQDVLRILQVSPRQLQGWERAGLIDVLESYTFQQLSQLRKLRLLSSKRIRTSRIYASVAAMQRVSGMTNPLIEAGMVSAGSRVVFRHQGAIYEPLTRQLVFDFEARPELHPCAIVGAAATQRFLDSQAAELFYQAVRMEDDQSAQRQVIDIYNRVLLLNPQHAAALINLGTIYYNQRQYVQAEEAYRRATVADPNYALAFFDLGNALDELHRLMEAIEAYRTAIRLMPKYADAHYNLALAYERIGEQRRALPHWMTYTRLDPIGPWSNHARGQARRLVEAEHLEIVARR